MQTDYEVTDIKFEFGISMSIGKHNKFIKAYKYDILQLIRICSSRENCIVIGFSKLRNHF